MSKHSPSPFTEKLKTIRINKNAHQVNKTNLQYVKSEDLCDGGTRSGNENVLEMERDSVA